jgi:hypothetical protein
MLQVVRARSSSIWDGSGSYPARRNKEGIKYHKNWFMVQSLALETLCSWLDSEALEHFSLPWVNHDLFDVSLEGVHSIIFLLLKLKTHIIKPPEDHSFTLYKDYCSCESSGVHITLLGPWKLAAKATSSTASSPKRRAIVLSAWTPGEAPLRA